MLNELIGSASCLHCCVPESAISADIATFKDDLDVYTREDSFSEPTTDNRQPTTAETTLTLNEMILSLF